MSARVRWSVVLAALLAAGPALGQAAQGQPPPAQPPAAQPPPPPAPGSQSTAGSQGESSSAQPSSPGASSQQVVVNPPQPVPPPAPPSSTTVVNPPPSGGTTYVQPPVYADVGVVERRREKPSPLATVAMDAAYGGVAGLLVGGGVALVEQGDNWGRDIMVGAGLGLIVGAAVGVVHAVIEQQQYDRDRRRADAGPPPATLARDGQNRTDRDPVINVRAVGLAIQF